MPQSVVTVVNGFTKVFIGEIIEKARTVQDEWAAAYDLSARVSWEREQAELEAAAIAKAEAETRAKAEAEAKAKENRESELRSSSASSEFRSSENISKEVKNESQSPTDPSNVSTTVSLPTASTSQLNATPSTPNNTTKIEPNFTPRTFIPPVNPHRGQLLPDHIREALRRYKRDGEGGGTGMSGLSQPMMGVRGAFTWQAGSGGKRLFR